MSKTFKVWWAVYMIAMMLWIGFSIKKLGDQAFLRGCYISSGWMIDECRQALKDGK